MRAWTIASLAFVHILAFVEALRAGEVWLGFLHSTFSAEAFSHRFGLFEAAVLLVGIGGIFAADGLILIWSLKAPGPGSAAADAETPRDLQSDRHTTPGLAAGIGAIALLAAIAFSLAGTTRIAFVAVVFATAALVSLLLLLLRISELSRTIAVLQAVDAHITVGQRHLNAIRTHTDRRTQAV